MNKDRRKTLATALNLMNEAKGKLDEAKCLVEGIAEEERDAFDNMPEGLQTSERGEQTEQNADTLETQSDEIDSLVDEVCGFVDKLEEIVGELENVD